MTKHKKILLFPQLDSMSPAEIDSFLEHCAGKEAIAHANWSKDYPSPAKALFSVARGNERLCIRFQVKAYSLKAAYDKDGSPVYKDSCVEFFMKQPEERTYRNFEFNCIGTCDAARRLSRNEKTSLSPQEYNSILRHPQIGRKPFEEIKGIHEWSLTVAIPFFCMDIDPNHIPEKILCNFYHCADGTEKPRYISWKPIHTPEPDFHRPEFFGELLL